MDEAIEPDVDDAHGLQWAERFAPSPFMREVARLAQSRRMSASEIRRRLHFAHVSTVFNHLRASAPRSATIDKYCELFGISQSYRDLLLDRPIADDRLAFAEFVALTTVDDSIFEPTLGEKVRAAWAQDRVFRRTCLEAYMLADLRTAAGYFRCGDLSMTLDGDIIPGVSYPPAPAALLRAIGVRFAPKAFVRRRKAVDEALTRIALDFDSLLHPRQLDALIEIVRTLLLANGHDLTFAEKRLAKQLRVLRRLRPGASSGKESDPE